MLDEVIASARDDGPPADTIVTRYFKQRRYAGSKDRRAVRELVFRAIRAVGRAAGKRARGDARPGRGRAGAARAVRPAARPGAAAPTARAAAPSGARARLAASELSPLVGDARMAGAARARAARPPRQCCATLARRACSTQFDGAEPTPLSPWGIRLPADSRVDDHPAFAAGLVEVQDEGSQLIALACEPARRRAHPRPVRGSGRQVAGAGRRGAGRDDPRDRQQSRAPVEACPARRARRSRDRDPAARARRANSTSWPTGAVSADLVLVDAPCSGSGTWRRNPEGRWRLTPERLDRLVDAQQRLLDIAAELVKPGGRLVYAVCSLLSREGAGQIERFLSRHSSWISEESPIAARAFGRCRPAADAGP